MLASKSHWAPRFGGGHCSTSLGDSPGQCDRPPSLGPPAPSDPRTSAPKTLAASSLLPLTFCNSDQSLWQLKGGLGGLRCWEVWWLHRCWSQHGSRQPRKPCPLTPGTNRGQHSTPMFNTTWDWKLRSYDARKEHLQKDITDIYFSFLKCSI